MKKLLTICLIMATTLSISAQEGKPTKEETIAYLDKVLKMSIGYKHYGVVEDIRQVEFRIKYYSFTESKVTLTQNQTDYRNHSSKNGETSWANFDWTNVKSITTNSLSKNDQLPNDSLWRDKELESINIKFSNPIIIDWGDGPEPRYSFGLLVLKTKADSAIKALNRLIELAKEENKDPFKD
ncbi:hypothetical protein FBBAL38_11744 [Flavobacteria bacterium BAL38]|nr:hypothetical protein FBBAL38_11744 [Flavobacteria bacterium BAL38]